MSQDKFEKIMRAFFVSYDAALKKRELDPKDFRPISQLYISCVREQLKHPFTFEPFHQKIRSPIDYYALGLDFLRPLIIFENSKVLGLEQLIKISKHLSSGENVVLFSNHQTEVDPQVISLLLEKDYAKLAEEMIFVAGDRVISDPMAVPLSMGRNLLCIYSKKRIDHPPELKEKKQLHNQKTMKLMSELLSEGGKCIYVAPSGGRDRMNSEGRVEVAHFDAQSIEMFWLMAQKATSPTHFYPLALATYSLLPPPNSLDPELGETRTTVSCPVHLAFGEEISMDGFSGSEEIDKKKRRQLRSDYIWNLVNEAYQKLIHIQ